MSNDKKKLYSLTDFAAESARLKAGEQKEPSEEYLQIEKDFAAEIKGYMPSIDLLFQSFKKMKQPLESGILNVVKLLQEYTPYLNEYRVYFDFITEIITKDFKCPDMSLADTVQIVKSIRLDMQLLPNPKRISKQEKALIFEHTRQYLLKFTDYDREYQQEQNKVEFDLQLFNDTKSRIEQAKNPYEKFLGDKKPVPFVPIVCKTTVVPTSMINRQITDLDLFEGGVMPLENGTITATIHGKNGESVKLTELQKQVQNAIGGLLKQIAGDKKGMPPQTPFTYTQIYREFAGLGNRTSVTPTQEELISNTVKELHSMQGDLYCESYFDKLEKKRGDFMRNQKGRHLIDGWEEIIRIGNETKTGFMFTAYPMFFEFSLLLGQIATIPKELLLMSGTANDTPERVLLRRNIATEILVMVSHQAQGEYHNNRRTYETLFNLSGINLKTFIPVLPKNSNKLTKEQLKAEFEKQKKAWPNTAQTRRQRLMKYIDTYLESRAGIILSRTIQKPIKGKMQTILKQYRIVNGIGENKGKSRYKRGKSYEGIQVFLEEIKTKPKIRLIAKSI